MARKSPSEITVLDVSEPSGIACPEGWQKAERAIIRLEVKSRDPIVGVSDYKKIIPREWSGYWYLYKDNFHQKSGSIEFKAQEIYHDKYIWTGEITTQQMSQRLPLIETTQPEENVEELSEFLILGGEVLGSIFADLDIPIIGDILTFISDFFENLSSDDLDYYPSPWRPDFLYIWVPTGLVAVDVSFIWYPYSPIAFGAGIAEVSIEELQEIPDLFDADDPTTPLPIESFDQRARALGYILATECEECEEFSDELARANGYIPSSECEVLATPKVRYLYQDLLNTSISGYYVKSLAPSTVLPISSFSITYSNYNPSGGGTPSNGRRSTLTYTDANGVISSLVLENNGVANHLISEVTFGFGLIP